MIKMIANVDSCFGIAKNGKIPWSFKEDLLFFKQKTIGQTVIMGKNTFLSLPNGPLVDRKNCVISSTLRQVKGVKIYRDIDECVKENPDAWIIGGAQVYNYAIRQKIVKYALLTIMTKDWNADLFIDKISEKENILYKSADYSIVEYFL